MLETLQAEKSSAWADVERAHAALIEQRSEAAADAFAAALRHWWSVCALLHAEVMARLETMRTGTR